MGFPEAMLYLRPKKTNCILSYLEISILFALISIQASMYIKLKTV
jgi:hypothetical protein